MLSVIMLNVVMLSVAMLNEAALSLTKRRKIRWSVRPRKSYRKGRLIVVDLLVLTSLNQLCFSGHSIYLLCKPCYLNEEDNCTERPPSVSDPWFVMSNPPGCQVVSSTQEDLSRRHLKNPQAQVISPNLTTIFYQVQCALFYIENDAEIFPVHYTWKVAEKGFKMAFMTNKLAIINSCKNYSRKINIFFLPKMIMKFRCALISYLHYTK